MMRFTGTTGLLLVVMLSVCKARIKRVQQRAPRYKESREQQQAGSRCCGGHCPSQARIWRACLSSGVDLGLTMEVDSPQRTMQQQSEFEDFGNFGSAAGPGAPSGGADPEEEDEEDEEEEEDDEEEEEVRLNSVDSLQSGVMKMRRRRRNKGQLAR